jgi:hypothetical protein
MFMFLPISRYEVKTGYADHGHMQQHAAVQMRYRLSIIQAADNILSAGARFYITHHLNKR